MLRFVSLANVPRDTKGVKGENKSVFWSLRSDLDKGCYDECLNTSASPSHFIKISNLDRVDALNKQRSTRDHAVLAKVKDTPRNA